MKTRIDMGLVFDAGDGRQNLPSRQDAQHAQKVLSSWFDGDILDVRPSASGWSGMQCFDVQLVGSKAHLKLTPSSKRLDPTAVDREVANARWAASCGIGPVVLWADVKRQALLTEHVTDTTKAAQGVRTFGPVFNATLRALHSLHNQSDITLVPFNAEQWRQKLHINVKQAIDSRLSSSLELADIQAVGEAIIDRLSRYPVRQGLCHGDMNGVNSIYTPKKVFIIDWTYVKPNDTIYELAYFGAHSGCEMAQMPRLWRTYSSSSAKQPAQLEQLRLHLALFHCIRFAMRVRGMPWHKQENRAADIAKASRQIEEDVEQLGLKYLLSAAP